MAWRWVCSCLQCLQPIALILTLTLNITLTMSTANNYCYANPAWMAYASDNHRTAKNETQVPGNRGTGEHRNVKHSAAPVDVSERRVKQWKEQHQVWPAVAASFEYLQHRYTPGKWCSVWEHCIRTVDRHQLFRVKTKACSTYPCRSDVLAAYWFQIQLFKMTRGFPIIRGTHEFGF